MPPRRAFKGVNAITEQKLRTVAKVKGESIGVWKTQAHVVCSYLDPPEDYQIEKVYSTLERLTPNKFSRH